MLEGSIRSNVCYFTYPKSNITPWLYHFNLQEVRNTDNRLLIDCIDHELVHVEDILSGRAFRYFRTWGAQKANDIMDYKAYYQNQWYNENIRTNNPIPYTEKVNYYKDKLPSGWWEVRQNSFLTVK